MAGSNETNTGKGEQNRLTIQSKLQLLSRNFQPMVDRFYQAKEDPDWDKYRFDLYLKNPARLAMNSLKHGSLIKILHYLAGAIGLFFLGSAIEDVAAFLEGTILVKNELLAGIITNNGESKVEDVLGKIGGILLIFIPFYIVLYTGLHVWNIPKARSRMKDWNHPLFNLGLYYKANPNEYSLIEPFTREYFNFQQFEEYVLQASSSEVLELVATELYKLKADYEEQKKQLLAFNSEKQGLNELLDVFQRNFVRAAEAMVSNDYRNFELDFGLISPRYSIYELQKGHPYASRIEPNTIPGASKQIEVNSHSDEPVIRLYFSPHSFTYYQKSRAACFKVAVANELTWIIKYEVNEELAARMKYLTTDENIVNEDAIISKNIYEIIRLHLHLQYKVHHVDVKKGGER
ncbi:hypothetical protein [Bacillus sp. FJAT-27251]|uniref:hypothetical protein n=1 Tax=Bacillus sp. FJAT-27251 TaxID=1684142 RepID=UPI0006A7996A|nr:hypothetical protein [Bacillus sp. FJAT-27251]